MSWSLLKPGVDTVKTENYLVSFAPDLTGKFKTLVSEAE